MEDTPLKRHISPSLVKGLLTYDKKPVNFIGTSADTRLLITGGLVKKHLSQRAKKGIRLVASLTESNIRLTELCGDGGMGFGPKVK